MNDKFNKLKNLIDYILKLLDNESDIYNQKELDIISYDYIIELDIIQNELD